MPSPFLDGSSNPLQQRGFSFGLIERTTVKVPERIHQKSVGRQLKHTFTHFTLFTETLLFDF